MFQRAVWNKILNFVVILSKKKLLKGRFRMGGTTKEFLEQWSEKKHKNVTETSIDREII